jgi:hypothetical protein
VQVGANAKINLKFIGKKFLGLLTHEFLDKLQQNLNAKQNVLFYTSNWF